MQELKKVSLYRQFRNNCWIIGIKSAWNKTRNQSIYLGCSFGFFIVRSFNRSNYKIMLMPVFMVCMKMCRATTFKKCPYSTFSRNCSWICRFQSPFCIAAVTCSAIHLVISYLYFSVCSRNYNNNGTFCIHTGTGCFSVACER